MLWGTAMLMQLTQWKYPGSVVVLACLLGACNSPRAASAPSGTAEAGRLTEALPVDGRASKDAPAMSHADAHHLLSRFSFGVRQVDLSHAQQMNASKWLEVQLAPAAIDDGEANELLKPHLKAVGSPSALKQEYRSVSPRRHRKGPDKPAMRYGLSKHRLIQDAQMLQAGRQIASNRQLLETMVAFWFDHFNVYARKGRVALVVTDYIEHAIRPHALGRFEDLLMATARHPAMLIYLDNYLSAVPKTGGESEASAGISENYARELLELHTVGVHGGYTQKDIIEVARILSGWTVGDLNGDPRFEFDPAKHAPGSKTVLGKVYASRGEAEGVDLLRNLARSPATARHLGEKLCRRFVMDTPPPACIAAAQDAYLRSNGDIATVLRSVASSPTFWSGEARLAKIKSPHEFLISACRVLGVFPDPVALARLDRSLGQPLLVQPVPTGYPDVAQPWLTTSGMLSRMNAATDLSSSRVRGAKVDLDDLLDPADPVGLADQANQLVLTGLASPRTLELMRESIEQDRTVPDKRSYALALALGSPDFQRR